jgi:hypothetical protein
MGKAAILLPMCALAAWTFAVLLLIAIASFRAAGSCQDFARRGLPAAP